SPPPLFWRGPLRESAGAGKVYSVPGVRRFRFTGEGAVARQPDVVVACWCGFLEPPSVDRICNRPGWENVPAVRAGRVAVVAEDLFGRPGPRLADGLQRLAGLLHPEL